MNRFRASRSRLELTAARLAEPVVQGAIGSVWLIMAAGLCYCGFAGSSAMGMQTPDALSPEQQVEQVEKAVLEAQPAEASASEDSKVVLSGRFVTPRGDPSGAGYAHLMRESVHQTIKVHEDGTFQQTVPAGTSVYLVSRLDAFATRAYGPFRVPDKPLDVGTLTVTKGFQGMVRVVDPTGKPIPGATVTSATLWVELDENRRSGTGVTEFTGLVSDEQGLLKFPRAIADQTVELSLRKPGYEFDRREIAFTRAPEPVRWALSIAEATTGRLVESSSGEPIAGGKIYLVRREGFAPAGPRDPRNAFARAQRNVSERMATRPLASSDGEGRFTIDTWRRDSRYWILILSPDHRPRMVEELASGQQLGDLEMEPPLTVRGRLAGDLSVLTRQRDAPPKLAYRNDLQAGDQSCSDLFVTPVAPDGAFQIDQLLSGELELLLPGGTKHLSVTESIDDVSLDLTKPTVSNEDDRRRIQVTLNPTVGQPLRGRVRLSWSFPADRTRERGQLRHQTFDVAGGKIDWKVPVGATLWIHDAGLIGSRLPRPKLGVVAEGNETDEIIVPLEPAGAVAGRVLSAGGQPVEEFRLMVDQNLPNGSTKLSIATERFVHPEGRFAIAGLPIRRENRYRIFAVVDGTAQAVLSESSHISADQPVADVTIQMPPAVTVTGRLIDARGEPVADASLSITTEHVAKSHSWSRSLGVHLKTDADGKFKFLISDRSADLAYEIRVHPTAEHAGRTIEISPQRWPVEGTLGTVRLSRAATVHGRVLGSDGKPRSGIHVMLMPIDREAAEYRGHRSDRTGDDGEFEIIGLEPIRQKLYLHSGEIVDVQGPFETERDEFSHPYYWAVQPDRAVDPATILIED